MTGTCRSYQGAPRVYLTYGIHEDGEWKRMWFVNGCRDHDECDKWGHHFWTWREAIDYALSIPVPEWAHPRRQKTTAN